MSDTSDDPLRKVRETIKRELGESGTLPDAGVFSFSPAAARAAPTTAAPRPEPTSPQVDT